MAFDLDAPVFDFNSHNQHQNETGERTQSDAFVTPQTLSADANDI